jgi:hypothetical protein
LSPSPVATRVTVHRNDALTVQHPELASPPPTDTDDLTTTPAPAPNHVHDQVTTSTTATTSTTINHHQDRLQTLAPFGAATPGNRPGNR